MHLVNASTVSENTSLMRAVRGEWPAVICGKTSLNSSGGESGPYLVQAECPQ